MSLVIRQKQVTRRERDLRGKVKLNVEIKFPECHDVVKGGIDEGQAGLVQLERLLRTKIKIKPSKEKEIIECK